ncbi:MAG: hypothetical protein KF905_09465 [Flavobacteriales bacterium]|nr:hypothetical protein [Flavobacteriales bacterium]
MKSAAHKSLPALALLLFAPLAAIAQPSDQQIIKDLTKPGVTKVELMPGPTRKEWYSMHAQYLWQRGAYVWQNANVPEYPDAKVKYTGLARYHYGASTSFREFKVADSEYFGLPAPSKDEMLGMIRERYLKFLGWRANAMVGDLHYMRIPKDEGVTWHTPNSFTIPVEIAYDHKTSYTEVTTTDEIVDVRFYRDGVNEPWKENIVSSERERKDGAVRTYRADELAAMPSMKQELEEKQARAAMAALPAVNIPAFKTEQEVFMHTHKVLREGSRAQAEAYLMQMLAPSYFMEGSSTQLNVNGARLVNNALDAAFDSRSPYAEQYCPDPAVKRQQPGQLEWWNGTQDKHTRMTVVKAGGEWKNGQRVGETWKITALEVWMWNDKDNIARIKSYEPGALCKGSGARGSVQPTGGSSGSAAPAQSTNTQGGGKGGELLNKGKGLLDRVAKP